MAEKATNNDMVLKLSRAYKFEGREIDQIDLSGLDDITAEDMIRANRALTTQGAVSVLPELSLEYALHMAASVAHLPIEFFRKLKPRDAMNVKNEVTNFLFGED